jgi:hypothetical protein
MIRAKRDLNKKNVGDRVVTKVRLALERKDYFGEPKG